VKMAVAAFDDELLQRLRRFQDLGSDGQHPKARIIGCSDSHLVPYLLTDWLHLEEDALRH